MCKCAERRAAIVTAVKKPSTALTAAKFVAKTSVQDIKAGGSRVAQYLKRRGLR